MLFGQIYGAVFFFGLCGWLGLKLVLEAGSPWRMSGLCVILLGTALAAGLLQQRIWARWSGVFSALLAAGVGFRLAATSGGLVGNVLMLSAAATAGLLFFPATGDPRRGSASADPERSSAARGLPVWVALVAFAGLSGSSWWAWSSSAASSGSAPGHELPSSAIAQSVRWVDFGSGLERARREGKPILATFVTDWCPYCKKMRGTWREPAVTTRLAEVVTVRVDAEEAREKNGFAGRELAERYRVQGYPAQILLDAEGRIVSRYDGYQTARQMLSWLESALGQAPSGAALGLRSATR